MKFYIEKEIIFQQKRLDFWRAYLKKNRKIHFVGIGGVGMSGLAKFFLKEGFSVSGSDIRENYAVQELRRQGAKIFLGHRQSQVKGKDLVCYSSAITGQNPEVKGAKKYNIPLIKRGLLLASLAQDYPIIAVSGSHGKTTTTALTSFLLAKLGVNCYSFVGGQVLENEGCKLKNKQAFVIETDESDGSFNFIAPDFGVITNIDKEHLSFYRQDFSLLVSAFAYFFQQTKKVRIFCAEDLYLRKIAKGLNLPFISYGLKSGNLRAQNIKLFPRHCHFDMYFKGNFVCSAKLSLPGAHNVLNALAALSAAAAFFSYSQKGEFTSFIKPLAQHLKDFKGVRRRLEILGKKRGILFVSDYAHHPSEIKAAISAARLFKPKRLIAIFQPHRPSRVRNLISEFASAFKAADFLVVTDIYLAAEKKEDGINADFILKNLRWPKKGKIAYFAEGKIGEKLGSFLQKGDLVLALGAGSIDSIMRDFLKSF